MFREMFTESLNEKKRIKYDWQLNVVNNDDIGSKKKKPKAIIDILMGDIAYTERRFSTAQRGYQLYVEFNVEEDFFIGTKVEKSGPSDKAEYMKKLVRDIADKKGYNDGNNDTLATGSRGGTWGTSSDIIDSINLTSIAYMYK